MAVFEFNDIKKDDKSEVVTYEVFDSDRRSADYNNPILIIDNNKRQWAHHSNGMFQSPLKGSGFEFRVDDTIEIADIIRNNNSFCISYMIIMCLINLFILYSLFNLRLT